MNFRNRRLVIAVIVLLAMTFTTFTYLDRESLWYDEAYTWWVASQVSVEESIASSVYEIIPPGSYLLWRGWIILTGETEFAMRMLAALMGILTAVALARTTYRLAGADSAIILLLAMWVSPVQLWASSEVRMYGPLLCFCALSGMALMEVLFTSRRRKLWLGLWALFSLASLYMTITAVFWLLAEGVFTAMILLLRARNQHSWQPVTQALLSFALPVIGIAVGFLPWVIAAIPSLGINTGYWPGRLTMDAFLKTAVQGMTVFDMDLSVWQAWIWGAVVCGLTVLIVLVNKAPLRAKLFPLAGVVTLLLQGVLYRSIPKWGVRHATLYAPLVLIAISTGVHALPRYELIKRRDRFLLLCVLMATAIIGLGKTGMLDQHQLRHEDWRAAATYVDSQRLPGDVVIVETGSVYPTWIYYAGDEGLLPLPDEPLLNVYNVLNYENTAPVFNDVLEPGQQVFVVDWLGEVTDPTDIVTTLLDGQGTELETPEVHGIALRHYMMDDVHTLPEHPASVTRYDAELLPGLMLWGVTLPDAPIPNDSKLDILTWWQTEDPTVHTAKFYQVSLRLRDQIGYTWLQVDATPGGGDYRPERWRAGEVVLGRFERELPEGLAPGSYELFMVLYDEQGASMEYALGSVSINKGEGTLSLPDTYTAIPGESTGALSLRGIRVNQVTVAPGETLSGELLWQVLGDLDSEYRYDVALGETVFSFNLFSATMSWTNGDSFRTSFILPIPKRALDLQAPLNVHLYRGTQVDASWSTVPVAVISGRAFALPGHDVYPADVRVGDVAMLAAYDYTENISAGEPFEVTLYWRSELETDIPIKVFVHVTALDNAVPLAQHDAEPDGGARPMATWVQGEIITDVHLLDGLPAGRYAVRVGMYGPDVVRLPLSSGTVEIVDNALILPEVLVVQ